jgi:hypothetical protein
MCSNYQDLSQILTIDHDRSRKTANGQAYTPVQRDQVETAWHKLSAAIDALNEVVELPKGS